jgi:histidine triad (HIT) family protein
MAKRDGAGGTGASRVIEQPAKGGDVADADCIFCKIASNEMESDVVHEGDRVVAFRDANPQAPTHVLVIPREHIPSVNDLEEDHASLVGELYLTARDVAAEEGIDESGYRLVMNTGRGAGQSVFHIHLHLLGGRSMGWPPG